MERFQARPKRPGDGSGDPQRNGAGAGSPDGVADDERGYEPAYDAGYGAGYDPSYLDEPALEAPDDAPAGRGSGSGRPPAAAASPDPRSLSERLVAARERKGVDLNRAERDTKIRARYLAALERGDFKDLPGTVYTKGFLRNYALYLGLDPDEALHAWHRERGEPVTENLPVVPRALEAPSRGITISAGFLAAIVLGIFVVGFGAYLALQVFRFAQPPVVKVSDPSAAVTTVSASATTYTLHGTTQGGAVVAIAATGRDTQRITATGSGDWSAEVELRRGRNQFDITVTDPATGQSGESPLRIYIDVPYPEVQAPVLGITSPAEGAQFQNGAIPVEGTASNATTVTVSAVYLGPVSGATPSPAPSAPAPATANVGADGTFSLPFELTGGRWALTVSATNAQSTTTSLTRTVIVNYSGVSVTVSVKGGKAWLKAWVDGNIDPGLTAAGTVLNDGQSVTLKGATSVEVRTGASGATRFSVNGVDLGALGSDGAAETWLFTLTAPPSQTQHK
jgi:cytoskeletal protein RodZ